MPRFVVVGGGAAGFFAAINAKLKNKSLEVIILEQGKSVLNKVKISGGGRCNVTHACWEPSELVKHYPRGSKELLGPFHKFCTGDTMEWFESRGVPLKIEADNRVFPQSDDSQSIIDCLWREAKQLGIKVFTKQKVTNIQYNNDVFKIFSNKENIIEAEFLMLATGSSLFAWKILEKMGHTIIKPVPSLFTFNIKDNRLNGLQGLSFKNTAISISDSKLSASGPLLITHWGLSGPAILKLSAWGARELATRNYDFTIFINFSPFDTKEEVKDFIAKNNSKKTLRNTPLFDIPRRYWESVLSHCKLIDKRWCDLSKANQNDLIEELFQAKFQVNGKSTFKEEFVTAGGVSLKEVDFRHFSSKIIPNLFLAGEVINIDAITGGFNFQAAWTGGFLVGQTIGNI